MFKEYEEYIETLQVEGKSKDTIRSYSKTLGDFLATKDIKSLAELTSLEIADYSRYQLLLQKKYSKATAKLKIVHIKSFLRWLFHYGFTEDMPDFRLLRPIKPKKKEVIVLSPSEIEQVLNAPVRLQYKIQIRLMLDLGLRNVETTNVQIRDIIKAEGLCKLKIIGKGEKYAKMPISDELCAMISEYLSTKKDVTPENYLMSLSGAERLGNSPINTSAVWQRVREILLASGIPEDRVKKLSPHTFRKNFVSRLANDEKFSSAQVQLLARHDSFATTQRYIRVDEKLAHEKLLQSQGSKS